MKIESTTVVICVSGVDACNERAPATMLMMIRNRWTPNVIPACTGPFRVSRRNTGAYFFRISFVGSFFIIQPPSL